MSARLRAVVVDDEELARQRIVRLLARAGDTEVVGECADGDEAVAAIRAAAPDVVFLDIQMPGRDGFGVVAALADLPAPPQMVFVTAFDRHAIRAFEVSAADYLVKPVESERFEAAMERVRARHAQAGAARQHDALLRALHAITAGAAPPAPAPDAAPLAPASRIVVREQERIFFLRAETIDWIEGAGNYVRVHVGARSHMVREPLGVVEEALDPGRFVRIHRSTIVNLDRVKEMQPWFSGQYLVLLENGTQLKMSRRYRDRVIGRLAHVMGGA